MVLIISIGIVCHSAPGCQSPSPNSSGTDLSAGGLGVVSIMRRDPTHIPRRPDNEGNAALPFWATGAGRAPARRRRGWAFARRHQLRGSCHTGNRFPQRVGAHGRAPQRCRRLNVALGREDVPGMGIRSKVPAAGFPPHWQRLPMACRGARDREPHPVSSTVRPGDPPEALVRVFARGRPSIPVWLPLHRAL